MRKYFTSDAVRGTTLVVVVVTIMRSPTAPCSPQWGQSRGILYWKVCKLVLSRRFQTFYYKSTSTSGPKSPDSVIKSKIKNFPKQNWELLVVVEKQLSLLVHWQHWAGAALFQEFQEEVVTVTSERIIVTNFVSHEYSSLYRRAGSFPPASN